MLILTGVELEDVPATFFSAFAARNRILVAFTTSHIRLAVNWSLKILEEELVCALERACPYGFLFALIHHGKLLLV